MEFAQVRFAPSGGAVGLDLSIAIEAAKIEGHGSEVLELMAATARGAATAIAESADDDT